MKSDDFFDDEEYPKLKFESNNFKKVVEIEYKVTSELTIRDITKEIELDIIHGGTVGDHYGQTKAGFELTSSINRKVFNLT